MVIMSFIFSSCSSNESGKFKEIEYGTIEADWPVWDNVNDLVESENTDQVLIGKIVGISFQVIDKKTGLPPAKDAKMNYDIEYGEDVEPWRVFEIITLYDIDVISVYKGEKVNFTQIRMMGGIKDIHIEEQLAVIKEYSLEYIAVLETNVELKTDEIYLFVLRQFDNTAPTPRNLYQSIYNIHNPFKKTAPDGYPDISAKDIISVFGKDKWDDFWIQWQKDNPNWETWLDKTEVEKELQKN